MLVPRDRKCPGRAAQVREHWVHLRTTNPIESTFAAVRHRTKITKAPGSRAAGLAMAFKLTESAQDRWIRATFLTGLTEQDYRATVQILQQMAENMERAAGQDPPAAA